MLEVHNFTQNEIDEGLFQRAAEAALKIVGIKGKIEISLAIIGDGRMRKLNKLYRGRNRATDVLSFGKQSGKSVMPYLAKAFPRLKNQPAGGKDIRFVEPPDNVNRLGEIVICYPRAKKQAKRMGHSLEKELTVLLIHGILHLSGYDHEKSGQEAEKMKEMEAKILKEFFK